MSSAAEFEKFFMVTVYTPNAKDDLSRLPLRFEHWDPAFLAYCKQLAIRNSGVQAYPAATYCYSRTCTALRSTAAHIRRVAPTTGMTAPASDDSV